MTTTLTIPATEVEIRVIPAAELTASHPKLTYDGKDVHSVAQVVRNMTRLFYVGKSPETGEWLCWSTTGRLWSGFGTTREKAVIGYMTGGRN